MAGYCLQSPSAIQGLMAGREVTIWRPRMDMQSTSAAAFTAHELPRCAPALAPPPLPAPPPMQCLSSYQSEFRHKALPAAEPLPPPPRLPHVPWEGQSTSQITYVAHPVRHTLLPPPPPRVVPPFYGTCTSHADYQAHPPVPRRPSVGLAMAGGRLHVLIPSIIPLPAIGTAELTTCHDNQTEMQLLVCEGELAHGGRLLAALPISGLPAGWRRGDVRVQVTLRQQECGSLEVLAECPMRRPQRCAWRIAHGADGWAAAQVAQLAC